MPTTPWQGSESIPRTLELINQGNGYQLKQHPIAELENIRDSHFSLESTIIDGKQKIDGFNPQWNVFELKASFKIESTNQVFGINLAENDSTNQRLIIGYDAATSNLFIDRRKAGTVNFNQAFATKMYAPVKMPADSILDLQIFMDQSSVEVFANDYQTVMTALVFTKPTTTGISVFSEGGPVEMQGFEAWKMNSIWGITPDQLPNVIIEKEHKSEGYLYPNPMRTGDKLEFRTVEPVWMDNGILELTDLSGRKIYNQSISQTYVSEIQIADLPEKLAKGNYILKLKSNKFCLVNKLQIL
ncbi:MAG: GH32 C-terminal domain-containing protein [Bacteroidales bacterium]|nr:GH32 C-terminal domain-containing protein [Bacteroidales bacterium]